jgi:diguanylate cyclase (GGDEF)-like protein/PAS domain S-box-containing protein
VNRRKRSPNALLLLISVVAFVTIVHRAAEVIGGDRGRSFRGELVEDLIVSAVATPLLAFLVRRREQHLREALEQRHMRETFESLIHHIDRMILRGDPRDAMLEFIAAQLAGAYDYPLVQISLKGADGQVEIRSAAGPAAAFLDDIDVRWDESPAGNGPTGTAIRSGMLRVSRVDTDPGFAAWRDRALAHGLRSVLALPLVANDRILGALTLFGRDADGLHGMQEQELRSFAGQVALSIVAAAVQERIRLLTVACESAANAIVVTGVDGAIEWINPAFTQLTGWTMPEIAGRNPRVLRSGNHSRAFYRQMWETLLAGQVWRGEMYNRRKSGEIYAEEQTITPVRDASGAIAHFVAVKQDITERKRQEERIRHLAMHDTLTNLPNRRAFDSMLDRVLWLARAGTTAAILAIDVDDFKLVNDSAGHPVGDQLLSDLAQALEKVLRPGDFIARLGGDEFVVLLQSVGVDMAFSIAERLRYAAEHLWFEHEGAPIHVSISIGLAPIDGSVDAKGLLSHVDSALYSAKERGKNRTIAYPFIGDSGIHLAEASRWLSRVKTALRDGGFLLIFQPVVRLGNGEVEHYEALLRMKGDDGVDVVPDRFLPFAERYGLMPQIDRWVFDEVLRTLRQRPTLRIFANLSGASLNDESLLSYIERRLRDSELEPGRLSFEITESAAVADFASARNWIRRLKELGCLFALDDFGVGFSSLGYLRALAVDYVKIDRTFIRDVDTNLTNRALVQAVKTVAQTLGKEVIAEGVETEAHASVLRELGVEHGQGYHWGQPALDVIDAHVVEYA